MKKAPLLSRTLLRKFLAQKRLKGIAPFLDYIRSREHLSEFRAFCGKKGIELQESEGVLFHGSQNARSVVKPKDSYVYATDDPNYAIFLAVLSLKNGGASVQADREETLLSVDTDFVNGPSRFKEGYVHVLPAQGFRTRKNQEYVKRSPVTPLFLFPVCVEDLTVPVFVRPKLR